MSDFGSAALAVGQQAGGFLSDLFLADKQLAQNKKMAKYQMKLNEQYLQKQLDYNTPANQMKRFQEAGLNPNLIYGQGNAGNQSAPLTAPDIKPADYQKFRPELLQLYNQTRLADSQVQAQNANTDKIHAQTSLTRLQEQVMARNPMLNDSAFKATIDSMLSSAEIKRSESLSKGAMARWQNQIVTGDRKATNANEANIYKMMDAQLQLLEQKHSLGSSDQKIKSEILQNKEFQNDLMAIQKAWMENGDITPQHIFQFIQLFLMKLL